jgi:hypothetical protein
VPILAVQNAAASGLVTEQLIGWIEGAFKGNPGNPPKPALVPGIARGFPLRFGDDVAID